MGNKTFLGALGLLIVYLEKRQIMEREGERQGRKERGGKGRVRRGRVGCEIFLSSELTTRPPSKSTL